MALEEVNGHWLLRRVTDAVDLGDHDFDREELDYGSIPPDLCGRVTVRIEQRGKLTPAAHDLDE